MSTAPKTIIDPGSWQITGGGGILAYGVSRTYTWTNTGADRISVCFEVKLDSFEANRITQKFGVRLGPIGLQSEIPLVIALFTEDLKGGFVEVNAMPVPQDWRQDELDVAMWVHEDDILKCLDALKAGRELNFMLAKSSPPPAPSTITSETQFVVGMSFPNDASFLGLYNDAWQKMEKGQQATRARHLNEGWYRRRIGV